MDGYSSISSVGGYVYDGCSAMRRSWTREKISKLCTRKTNDAKEKRMSGSVSDGREGAVQVLVQMDVSRSRMVVPRR